MTGASPFSGGRRRKEKGPADTSTVAGLSLVAPSLAVGCQSGKGKLKPDHASGGGWQLAVSRIIINLHIDA